jgi:hypothetical protein
MFYRSAKTQKDKNQLVTYYKRLFHYDDDATSDYQNYAKFKFAMQPTRTRMNYKEIYRVMENVYSLEKDAKKRIKEVMKDENTSRFITDAEQLVLDMYTDKYLVYFLEPEYNNQAIAIFHRALNTYINIIDRRGFHLKKELLDFQLTLNYN